MFLTPLILWLLIPWAGLAVWVLIGRRPRTFVPFLPLWDAPEEVRRPRNRSLRAPPVAVVLALLAVLVAILAGARPAVRLGGAGARVVDVIVDRGATMSALSAGGRARYAEAADSLARALSGREGSVRLRVRFVPGVSDAPAAVVDARGLVAAVAGAPRTAVDTAAELGAAVRGASGDAIVLTDRDLGADAARVIVVPAGPAAADAGIERFTARAGQVMVVTRATGATERQLRITAGGRSVERRLALAGGGPQSHFVDLPEGTSDAPEMEARLLGADGSAVADAVLANDVAWLVRGRSWPAVEERTPLPEEVRRVLGAYRRHRPAGRGGATIAVARLVAGEAGPRASEPAVVLADTVAEGSAFPTSAARLVGDHPAVTPVPPGDLAVLATGTTVGPAPGPEWTAVLVLAPAGNAGPAPRAIVSVRETEGVRQVRINFDSPAFARTPGFVVLWSACLDWVAASVAPGEYRAAVLGERPLTELKRVTPAPEGADARYWPGRFEGPGGAVAVNAGVIDLSAAAPASDWEGRLARWAAVGGGVTELAGPACILALLLLTGAAATWERRRRPAGRAAHVAAETEQLVETTFEADGHAHRHTRLVPPK
ncbi:MAG TPA: hypothetical protein VEA69_09380 [Tepidisphaeraceae bacterium]|nr:hypothetical protein [Tepidisphaeraceae bacterium]